MPLDLFHPVISRWFTARFGMPTEPQRLGWPCIARKENVLIAAPTGSGKTLAAFLVCIDSLVQEAIKGGLAQECKVLYLSPLKALASDIKKNLETPLAEIQKELVKKWIKIPEIRAQVRTGDTPSYQRQKISKSPPHILVTTPESLYLMLTSEKGRHALRTVETVIVDEIHALARDKRGSHMTLSLQRLKAITKKPPTLIGLSATQKPVEEIANFLVGVDPKSGTKRKSNPCKIIDVGHKRDLDLNLIVPASPLSTLTSHEQWEEIYQLLAEQIRNHRSTLLFVNTRRLAERVAFRLAEVLGEDAVLCHHGSLSKNRRLDAETLLKEGKLRAIVATASLELGIDIGYIDLVCQLGVPFSIATFLQRIGRSGHAIKATPKGRLVPLSRDELVESFALIKAVREGNLDRIEIPVAPVDILVQQIIAECAGRELEAGIPVDEAFQLFSQAWPFRDLTREVFMKVVEMAAEGYAPGRRRYAYLMWDRIHERISVKSGARIAALTSGGAIPEMGDYRVVLENDGTFLGTVNEDFAIESLAGDIFVLGTHSWKIKWVRGGEVVVEDAQGQPPSIPFWLGEAPGRTKEFSEAVSSLRKEIGDNLSEENLAEGKTLTLETIEQLKKMPTTPFDTAKEWLRSKTGLDKAGENWPLLQAVHYIAAEKAALGVVPSREKVVFERFFDDVGGMHLVIHSSYGARMNRGWGLALRKRFCRQFDFELQASADDDGIVLSLGPQQAFALESFFKMLNEGNIEHFLTQALLQAPMFAARWRWNITRSLAVLRQIKGKRTPPALQRFRSEDLLTAVFPAQTACPENGAANGVVDIALPDHPLVTQTVHDCLTEAMDITGLKSLFRDIDNGKVKLIAKDTREPSPFAYQLVNSFPFAYLDDAPAEDRRTRSISMRPAISVQDLQDLARMDPGAIEQVKDEAWPDPRTADELYETLVVTPAFPVSRLCSLNEFTKALIDEKRAAYAKVKIGQHTLKFLVAAESVPLLKAAYEAIQFSQPTPVPNASATLIPRDRACQEILKGWLDISGPAEESELVELFGIDNVENHLAAAEAKGEILRCKLNPQNTVYSHWCSRGLLRRIHRLTVENLRERIRPVATEDYFEYLFEAHGLNLGSADQVQQETYDAEALLRVVETLQGFESPALSWERELFPGRLASYDPSWLDQLTSHGLVAFGRLTSKKARLRALGRSQKVTSAMPLSFVLRGDWNWIALADVETADPRVLSADADSVWSALKSGGAQFVDELEDRTRLLQTQVEAALGELAAEGLVTCDHFHALRNIISPSKSEKTRASRGLPRRFQKRSLVGSLGGRWSVLKKAENDFLRREETVEKWAWQLMVRYGVVFRDLLQRESLAPSWGDLVRALRKLEARGEVRGGRFILGVSGEQFALTETFEKLIKIREERAQGKRHGSYAVISSADPLNLIGIVTKGPKIASGAKTRILFEEGSVSAVFEGNEIRAQREISEERLRALRLIGTYRGQPPVVSLRTKRGLGDTSPV